MREERDMSRPLRLCLAMVVAASHSWTLLTGDPSAQPLSGTSFVNLGSVALNGFMALSGYYIASSVLRSGDMARFARARAARIFPALWAHAALGVVVAGAALSQNGAPSHLASPSTWTTAAYAALGIWGNPALTGSDGVLPGVFSGNPVARWNDPLWSIKAELAAYAAVAALCAIAAHRPGRRRILWLTALLPAALLIHSAGGLSDEPGDLTRLLCCFGIGMALRLTSFGSGRARDQVPPVAALYALAWMLAEWPGTAPLHWVATGMACILLSRIPSPVRWRADLSYGTYIWAFPCAQAIVASGAATHPLTLTAASLGAAVPIAAASWALVERPSIEWSRKKKP